jgi:hypothetical protein
MIQDSRVFSFESKVLVTLPIMSNFGTHLLKFKKGNL